MRCFIFIATPNKMFQNLATETCEIVYMTTVIIHVLEAFTKENRRKKNCTNLANN